MAKGNDTRNHSNRRVDRSSTQICEDCGDPTDALRDNQTPNGVQRVCRECYLSDNEYQPYDDGGRRNYLFDY